MQYRTIRAAASAEFVEKRSRFIGYISPVTTQQDAIAFIDSIKSKRATSAAFLMTASRRARRECRRSMSCKKKS